MTAQGNPAGATTGLVAWPGLYVTTPADPFVEAMEDAGGEDLLVLATRALRRDPGCIEARLVLAEYSRDAETRYRHLRAAVVAGDALWAPVAARMGGDITWWGFAGTRPYMRAIHALGQAHFDAGKPGAAAHCFRSPLNMDPNDSLGVRHVLSEMAVFKESAGAPGMR